MKKRTNLMVWAVLSVLSTGCVKTPPSSWGYSGAVGSHHWANLSKDNVACLGKNQSPVNLADFIDADLPAIAFSYRAGGHEIINNGHTVQVNYAKGSHIEIDDEKFHLIQFHFHSPSENTIKGQSYPLEAHFVHASDTGELAVIAVMYQAGIENKGLKKAWAHIPIHAGEQYSFTETLMAGDLLPDNKDYYRFNGSLTTPPCSEGVRWLVMKNTVMASRQQIDRFLSALHEPNNRPLQAINARPILQ